MCATSEVFKVCHARCVSHSRCVVLKVGHGCPRDGSCSRWIVLEVGHTRCGSCAMLEACRAVVLHSETTHLGHILDATNNPPQIHRTLGTSGTTRLRPVVPVHTPTRPHPSFHCAPVLCAVTGRMGRPRGTTHGATSLPPPLVCGGGGYMGVGRSGITGCRGWTARRHARATCPRTLPPVPPQAEVCHDRGVTEVWCGRGVRGVLWTDGSMYPVCLVTESEVCCGPMGRCIPCVW